MGGSGAAHAAGGSPRAATQSSSLCTPKNMPVQSTPNSTGSTAADLMSLQPIWCCCTLQPSGAVVQQPHAKHPERQCKRSSRALLPATPHNSGAPPAHDSLMRAQSGTHGITRASGTCRPAEPLVYLMEPPVYPMEPLVYLVEPLLHPMEPVSFPVKPLLHPMSQPLLYPM